VIYNAVGFLNQRIWSLNKDKLEW